MISMARTLGAPDTVPAGNPAISASTASCFALELSLHIGHDMHDLAVIFEEEAVGDAHAADLRDAADIVAAEVEQHQMLGALLGVGEKLLGERLVFLRRGAARPRAGDRAGW